MTSKNIPSVFKFESESAIRAVMLDGAPWFVASDVIKALQLTNATMSMKALDDDERSKLNLGRQGTANIISESGLYTLILRCRDAVTPGTIPYRFRKWVTGEVLPQIRRTGRYVREELSPADKAQKVVASFMPAILEAMKTEEKQEYSAPLKPNYREHIHSPEGVLGLTEHSLMMSLLRQLDADGHDVEGAVAEFAAMMSYIVGASKCLRDIQTHTQYINSVAGKF
ncbi:BRO-like protein [Salmonella enterica subsp. enterica]|uniref:BRO-like protein n=1 Tax=Salmonella enterica subsp. enterica serovar Albany TaxID=211968 RepID=A0A5U9QCD6_SALET|nr:BRO family protein [Salmonella enterica]EBF2784165.1 BRO-like protein [Salmonella enterica subsp. enterica serovar Corvallis]EBY8065214.1 BRO-like protein [Salmonella enterica subsp. enterica serovar Hadar]ECE0380759.1 BRO-like protein [Salmonella enterica subsp. enterica]EEA9082866.1 BRO-like protein [Salmonella enterica subsp. enterica serovar Duesseldorf]EAT9255679.1 BRO-like protein [Salmonella enterica]